MSDKINNNCRCPYNCPRHGDCEKCRAFHRKTGSKTHCGK